MATIELTDEEARALLELVDARLGEMSEEIYHSTVSTFKEELKHRKETLEAVREKLAAGVG